MDSLHAVGFYASAGVSLLGGLGVALLQRRDSRGAALAATAIGVAGIYLSLSAGFAALIALICLLACAFVIAGPAHRSLAPAMSPLWRQLGAISAALLFALLAFSAFKGDFVKATFYGGAFDTAALGRLLFGHDAVAVVAVGVLALVAIAGSSAAWHLRERPPR
ncbi:MAG TPA: hypothetical protein VNA65_03825 [Candidatus Dormibacteraeota bacterium]|nr:hypothetical protein [Candidatus Dormibacteraeota bacterium]